MRETKNKKKEEQVSGRGGGVICVTHKMREACEERQNRRSEFDGRSLFTKES